MTSKGNSATIRRLMEFVHVQAQMEANKPTFSKFLGLASTEFDNDGVAGVCKERFSFRSTSSEQQQSVVFRYKFPSDGRWKHLQDSSDKRVGPSLATYTSILDEVTTFVIVSAAKKHPRPGVSVTMQCQWGPGGNELSSSNSSNSPPTEVDVVTTLTKKGRTLAFCRAEVRDPSTDRLICYFDHVKYLPVGWVPGLLLSPFGLWCLKLFLKYLAPLFQKKKGTSKAKPLHHEGILESYQQTSNTTATFRFGPRHSNGMGGLHGGVQAIVMERLGTAFAKQELQAAAIADSSSVQQVECQDLSVSYQSSASKFLELKAHVLDPPTRESPTIKLRIEILRGRKPDTNSNNDGKPPKRAVVVSEGILTFGIASTKKDQ